MTPAHERLNGWKDIAAFLGKSVRTVQRWEQEYGLPVHRQGADGELIFAYRDELEAWVRAGAGGTRRAGRAKAGPHCVIWDSQPFFLGEGVTVLGRADDANVQILVPSVSRHHARIAVRGAEATLEDLASHHGTWLGATRVKRATPLTSGDEIRLGTALLVYRFVRSTDTTI